LRISVASAAVGLEQKVGHVYSVSIYLPTSSRTFVVGLTIRYEPSQFLRYRILGC